MSYKNFCDKVFKFAKRINVEFALRRIAFSGGDTGNYIAVFPTGEYITGNNACDKLRVVRGSGVRMN